MNKRKAGGMWAAIVVFGLMGQIAWTVENMYFNVFIYKMFHASAADISLMVTASAVSAALTTVLMGALSDKLGRRRAFIAGGYTLWGVSILLFSIVRMDVLTPAAGSQAAAASLGITLSILLDCVMTFFGSTANDAAYNAWLTDLGDETNRGRIEGLNSMMPLLSILIVFGGFMSFSLDNPKSWTTIFLIIGGVVLATGILGFFTIQESEALKPVPARYIDLLLHSFKIHTIKGNKALYLLFGCFSVFGVSIQIFMPYLILYYEEALKLDAYVLIMAPAVIAASVCTFFYGRVFDKFGFARSIPLPLLTLSTGYILFYLSKNTSVVFIASLLMMIGYLTGMAVFGAAIREHTPEGKAGEFQGVRIISQVLLPGVIGPAIGAYVLRNADYVVNQDGTTSFIPNESIWFAALAALILLIILMSVYALFKRRKQA